jgi:putative endonuclease
MSNFDLNNYVYITCNPGRTTFYIGVTNSLERRIAEHYSNKGKPETFVGKYYCYELNYFEIFQDIKEAIAREKELRGLIVVNIMITSLLYANTISVIP